MSNVNKNNFIHAIKYIYTHIDQPMQLENMASHIGVSLSSLKRLFEEVTNQSPGAFIRRLRMEFAFRSLQNKENTVLEVALSAGFEDHSAFSRCFKDTFGYPPTAARAKLNIINELECVVLEEPQILEIKNFSIQSVTEQGTYFEAAPKAWQALKDKLSGAELADDFSGTYIGIGHDNPHEGAVREDKVRFTAGIVFLERELGLSHAVVPGGVCAKFRYKGKLNNLGLAYHYIYGKWLESSDRKINQAVPAFMLFDGFPESFSEQSIVIYVSLND